jgi:predicted Zn-dependent protease
MRRFFGSVGLRFSGVWILLVAAIAASALGLAACATSPATGKPVFTGLMTTASELQIGRAENPRVLAAFGGAYADPALERYVGEVGARVARQSEREDITYSFAVLNSPIVNALAIPGGHIYITRGMLALINNEAEMAGVLGHEVGHIAALHISQQVGREQALGLGLSVLGAVVQEPLILRGTGLAATLYLRSFSRQEEYEADMLGVRYTARAGYDPRAMVQFLRTMKDYEDLDAKINGRLPGSAGVFSFLATHPTTVDRFQRAMAQARAVAMAKPEVGRDRYLKRIDGLLYGEGASEGFIRGHSFVHPILKIHFRFPDGFQPFNTPGRVFAVGPSNSLIVFDGVRGPMKGTVASYLAQQWARGVTLHDVRSVNINGLDAVTARTAVTTNRGPMEMMLAVIRTDPSHAYRFRAEIPPALMSTLAPAVEQTIMSFTRLTDREAAALKARRIRIVRVAAGETVEDLARKCDFENYPAEQFRVLNGLQPGEPLTAGQLVKIVGD